MQKEKELRELIFRSLSCQCKGRKGAERTLKHIIPFITEKLYLKVNLEKTAVCHISKVKYLGYGFYTTGWINYCRYADMKKLMEDTDKWLRHRICAVYWK
ncbi:MAG TPA: hypothetical protein H9696_01710 [Candidatus Anaerostipes avicola]|nr:hypothetical protein [Candidatus Anaerostipes avicola]